MPIVSWTRFRGLLATLAAILAVEILSQTLFRAASPSGPKIVLVAIPLLTVAYAAFVDRLRGGLLSATVTTIYAFYFFSQASGGGWAIVDQDFLRRAVTFSFLAFGLAVSVGILRRRDDRSLAREREQAAQLAARTAEIEHANARLEAANRALSASNEALEAFSYVVSHDLKEPVRAIEAYQRSLEEDYGALLARADPEAVELVQRTRKTTARLGHLLEGLIEYARAGRVSPWELERIRVRDALGSSECASRYEFLLQERNAQFLIEDEAPPVQASQTALCQILGNLVLNALRHNPSPTPLVRVRVAPWPEDARFVEVVVEDNGPGFPGDALRRFSKARPSGPATIGGGFGLVIARRSAEVLGGRLWLENRAEGGAAAHILLPAAAPSALPPDDGQSAGAPRSEVLRS